MSELFEVQAARADLYERAAPSQTSVAYVREHGVDTDLVAGFCGCIAVVPVLTFDGSMFDFADTLDAASVPAVVVEAFDRDGETTIDLVAWPLDAPGRVLSMFRRAPLLGLCAALNPYTYALGSPLRLHRTPLGWLQGGCVGAAVVTPHLAARTILDLPGLLAAEDARHAAEVDRLVQSLFDKRRVVVPRKEAA